MRTPTCSTSCGSHVAPSAVPQGKHAAACPVHFSPRAPPGPSVTLSGGTPSRSTPVVCQRSTPATKAAFSSSVMSPTSFSMRSLILFAPGAVHGCRTAIVCHDAGMEQLSGKVAVVTGAGSGIGRALVHGLAQEGMRIVAADIEEPALAETVAGHADATMLVTDVSSFHDVVALA